MKRIVKMCSLVAFCTSLVFCSDTTFSQEHPGKPTGPLEVSDGPFSASMESLANYQVPEWFRDAKFGIWAHWGPQCQPAAGDWYARNMYIEGSTQYKIHLEKYGHPSQFGFKDVINEWKADKFDAQALIDLYKWVGARYFYALAVHHDNFDLWDSSYQPWNAVNMGPKRDLVGEWAQAAKNAGLPFGLSFHARSAWTWYEPAQLADTSGVMKGIPYDGKLTREDGKGKWWEGYDPQDLYEQNHRPSPYCRDREVQRAHPGDRESERYCMKLYNRIRETILKYDPEMLYFDEPRLPMRGISPVYGMSIASNLYNESVARNGANQAIMNCKTLTDEERDCLIEDLEVATKDDITPYVWQCDACIGRWHYCENQDYVSAGRVVRALADVVSKNGNLLLSVPIRGDGTLDEQEMKILKDLGNWMNQNGEAIYCTRPWVKYGEGPSTEMETKRNKRGEKELWALNLLTSQDIRFTRKGDTLYAIVMAWPKEGRKVLIKSLAKGEKGFKGKVTKVTQLGVNGGTEELQFTHGDDGLEFTLSSKKPSYVMALTFRIEGLQLD